MRFRFMIDQLLYFQRLALVELLVDPQCEHSLNENALKPSVLSPAASDCISSLEMIEF